MFHRQRDSIETHLTIVFAALAISRHLQEQGGVSIKKLVRTLRLLRTVQIDIGGHTITAPPDHRRSTRHPRPATRHQRARALATAFEELGIPRWAERARAEAGRAGLHPTTITLTATNRRLAELVGSGHSNQGTGAELFMSVNTVEAWCTRVASACGARSVTSSPRQPSPARTGDSASRRAGWSTP